MPHWSYTEVSYAPSSKPWQEKAAGLTQQVKDTRFWLYEICEAMDHYGWELAIVFYEAQANYYHVLFKKPKNVKEA